MGCPRFARYYSPRIFAPKRGVMPMIKFKALIFIGFYSGSLLAEECEVTPDNLECFGAEFSKTSEVLEQVNQQLNELYKDEKLIIQGLKQSSDDWQVSFKSTCDSVYNRWRYSSYKNVLWLQCKIRLVENRISFLQEHFLNE